MSKKETADRFKIPLIDTGFGMMQSIRTEKERIYQEATDYFAVPTKEVPDRCNRGIVGGLSNTEMLFIDGQKVVTIETVLPIGSYAIELRVTKHYEEESK